MNAAHLHILVNHFPIIGFLIGLCIIFAGVFLGQSILRQTGLLILFLMALTSIPTFYSGHEAEDVVEKLTTESVIEAHEEAAEWAYYLTLAAGAVSGAAFIANWKNKGWGQYATVGAVTIALFAAAALARTGYLGGKIRHTEFTEGAPAVTPEPLVPHTHNHQH